MRDISKKIENYMYNNLNQKNMSETVEDNTNNIISISTKVSLESFNAKLFSHEKRYPVNDMKKMPDILLFLLKFE